MITPAQYSPSCLRQIEEDVLFSCIATQMSDLSQSVCNKVLQSDSVTTRKLVSHL